MNPSKSQLTKVLNFLGYLLAILIAAPAVIGAIANDATPLGVDSQVFIIAGVAVALGTVLVNMVIAAIQIWVSGHTAGVAWGLSSYVGYGLALLSGLATAVDQADKASAPLNVPPDVWVKLTAVITLLTTVGKGIQVLAVARNNFNPYIPGGVIPVPTPETPGVPPVVVVNPPVVTPTVPTTDPTTDDQGSTPSPGTDG